MSDVSAEEKRRLLRERRQAKMAQGKATERLNNILTQGSSVNSSSVKSVLETAESPSHTTPLSQSVKDSHSSPSTHPSSHISLGGLDHISPHADPEVPDISLLLQTGKLGKVAEENDMDEIMQKIFAGPGNHGGNPDAASETSQFFAEMMKTMNQDPNAIPETSENASYQTKLAVYHEYQQKMWKARFLIIRLIVHTINFLYHFLTISGFSASSHAFARHIRPEGAGSFMTIFVSVEIAVISSYYMILSSNGSLSVSSRNHPISKVLSLASAVFPQASAYQSLLDSALVYWGGASIIIGDLMLMVMYFGLASTLS